MAKDPAFLFYSNDFLTGTLIMSWEDRGKYITILCYMQQKGRLTGESIRLLVGSVSDDLKSKFEVDENGLFYNIRLEEEIEKRRKFIDSRRSNGSKGGRPKETEEPKENLSVNHKVNLMEDENVIGNINNKKGAKTEKPKKEDPTLILPFDTPCFIEIWELLRSEKKWKAKSQNALQLSLIKLSKVSEPDAIQMIKNAIEGNWQSVYPLKDDLNGNRSGSKAKTRSSASSAENIAEMDRIIAEAYRGR